MNRVRIEGNWKQFKGNAKEQWGKPTDDQLDRIAGKRDQRVGKIQENYGIAQDEAEWQVKDWENRADNWGQCNFFISQKARPAHLISRIE